MTTIKDIARYTGLALSTVSKYLNGGAVKDENRKKIEKALSVLNYRRNEAARSLKTNRSMTIGILVPNLKSHFDTSILSIVEEHLTNAGYSVIICSYHKDVFMEVAKLQFLFQKRVDGLILIPSGSGDSYEQLQDFIRAEIPVVLLDCPLPGIRCDTILTDNEHVVQKATEHLIGLGHRRIGILPGSENIFTGRTRLKGYIEAHRLAHLEIDHNLIIHGEWDFDSGYHATKQLLQSKEGITALIVCSDDMSYGALKALKEEGIPIPDQISLICYDFGHISQIFEPTISTIDQPLSTIGKLATDRLLHRINTNQMNQDPEEHIISSSLTIRDSIRSVPQ